MLALCPIGCTFVVKLEILLERGLIHVDDNRLRVIGASYDFAGISCGNRIQLGTTPSIPAGQNLGNGTYGQGGTYGVLLAQLIPTLPQGPFKILVDGGTYYSAVEVLQFNGPAASSLQVAYDSAPAAAAGTTVAAARRSALKASRVESLPKEVFRPAPR